MWGSRWCFGTCGSGCMTQSCRPHVAAVRALPPAALAVHVKSWSELASWPAPQRAVHFRLLNPKATDAAIAAAAGVKRHQLFTWPEYKRAKETVKRWPTLPPRGSVD